MKHRSVRKMTDTELWRYLNKLWTKQEILNAKIAQVTRERDRRNYLDL